MRWTATDYGMERFQDRIGLWLPSCEEFEFDIPPIPGRLGASLEGGGKRRRFAIGNYVNQRLLHPFGHGGLKTSPPRWDF